MMTRIDPYIKIKTKSHKRIVADWKDDWQQIKDRFPMFQESKIIDLSFADAVHEETVKKLCSAGDKMRPPEMDKNNKCFLLHRGENFLRLGPFKMEQFNEAPFVGKLHDFMSQKECEEMQALARGKMRSTPLTVADGNFPPLTYCTPLESANRPNSSCKDYFNLKFSRHRANYRKLLIYLDIGIYGLECVKGVLSGSGPICITSRIARWRWRSLPHPRWRKQ